MSSSEDEPTAVERSLHQMEDYIQQVLAFDVQQGTPTRVEKMLTVLDLPRRRDQRHARKGRDLGALAT